MPPTPSSSKNQPLNSHEIMNRLARLHKHGVNLNHLQASLKSAVLADFLERKYPQKRFLQVAKSFNVAITLQRIVPENPSPELLPLVENQVLHPGMAYETIQRICLAQRVFSLFWRDIFRMLPIDGKDGKQTQLTAINCNAVFKFAQEPQINWELSEKDFKAEVAFEMETESPDGFNYTELFHSAVFSEFWTLVKTYPHHALHQKAAVKASISRYLSQRKSPTLESVLQATFDNHGVAMDDDSGIIHQFCLGDIFCDPAQVVATVYLSATLSRQSLASWYCRELEDKYMARLKREVYLEGKAWMDAVRELTVG
ncbi:hypothetical protein HDU96_005086, partial [Phlyctochytrium bullatum]